MNIYYILFVFYLNLVTIAHAVAADILYNHCIDCGNVLVGAAKVEFNKIRWVGNPLENGNVFEIQWNSYDFGFTGAADFQQQLEPSKLTYNPPVGQNQWLYKSYSSVSLSSIIPNQSPFMGFFFAPSSAGALSTKFKYQLVGSSIGTEVAINGIGEMDNPITPALTIDVKPTLATHEKNGVEEIYGVKEETFVVKANSSSDSVKYIMVSLAVADRSSACEYGEGTQFTDSPQSQLTRKATPEEADGYTVDSYYQSISGEQPKTGCVRDYDFIVSSGKSFKFNVSKRRDSSATTDYTEYKFYIRGHYSLTPTDYPGSHKTFRLYTGGTTPTQPPANPKLTVQVLGSGKGTVSSNPSGIINCSNGTGTCESLNFSTGTTITLTATPDSNSTSLWTPADCQSFAMPAEGKTCVVTFSPKATPTKATLTVNIAKSQGTVLFNDEELTNCTDTSCSKEYTVAITDGVKLTPKPLDNYQFPKWSGDGCPKGDPNDNSITIKPVNLGDSKICTLSFEPKPVTTELKACIDPIPTENVTDITLTAKCSEGNIETYRWIEMLTSPLPSEQTMSTTNSVSLSSGDHAIRLEISDGTSIKTISSQIHISSLIANFNSWVNGRQVTLIPKPSDNTYSYTWFIDSRGEKTSGILTRVLPASLEYPITMIVSKDQETANISKVVKTVSSIAPKSDFRIDPISEKATPSFTFTLDASLSCDEDNIDDAGNNACNTTYSPLPANLDVNKGITKYSWTVNNSPLDFTKTQSLVAGNVTCTTENQGRNLKCSYGDTVQESLKSSIDISVSLGVQDDDVDQNGSLKSSTESSVERTIQLNRPVADFTVTQDVDKIITLTSTSQASGYSIAGIPQSTSISSYSWSVDNGTMSCDTNPCTLKNLKNGEHTISLTVTDNYGLKSLPIGQKIFVGDLLPSLDKDGFGQLEEQNNSSPMQQFGNSKFFGAICIKGKNPQCSWEQQVSQKDDSEKAVEFYMNIQTEPTFSNSSVNVLLVLAVDEGTVADPNTGAHNYSYHSVIKSEPAYIHKIPAADWLFSLDSYEAVHSLPHNHVPAKLVMGPSDLPAKTHYLFYGYEYTENNSKKLVYAPTPLILHVNP